MALGFGAMMAIGVGTAIAGAGASAGFAQLGKDDVAGEDNFAQDMLKEQGSAAAEGVTKTGANIINKGIVNMVNSNDDAKETGKYKGQQSLDYMNAAYPGTTPSERLGGGGGGSAGVQSSAAQSESTKSQKAIADKAHALAERGQRAQVISAYAQSPQHIKSALALLGSGSENVDIDSIPTNTSQNIEGRQQGIETQVRSTEGIKLSDRIHDTWKAKYMENNKKAITNLLVKADMTKLQSNLKNSQYERDLKLIIADIVHKDKFFSSTSASGAVGLYSLQEFNKGSPKAYAMNMLQMGFTAAAVGGFMRAFAKSGSKKVGSFGKRFFSKMRFGKKKSKLKEVHGEEIDITDPKWSKFFPK